jgi:hypothetical protein
MASDVRPGMWWIGGFVAVLLLAYFVWPTPWSYPFPDLRRNRFTGAYQGRHESGEWRPAIIQHRGQRHP